MPSTPDRPTTPCPESCACASHERVDVLLDEIEEDIAEIRRLRIMEATGQDLSLTSAAALISALVNPSGIDLQAQEEARAWLRAWESLLG